MKTIIQETNKGFAVLGETYRSLHDAIGAAGSEYTFIDAYPLTTLDADVIQ